VPRPVAWFLRALSIVPLLGMAGYALFASYGDPVRLGYRLFIPLAGLFAVMVWQLTKAADHPSTGSSDT